MAATMASPRFDPSWSRLPAGTEIPELRTSTSRTHSNGDGTFTAEITPARTVGTESVDSCQPASTGWISYFQDYHGHEYYSRVTPQLHYRMGNEWDAAYAKFDLSSIPDSSTVLNAQFRCYQYEVITTPMQTECTYPDVDPDAANDATVFIGVRYGIVLAQTEYDSVGWVTYGLSSQGVTILKSRLQQNWVTLGINPVSGEGSSFGIYGDYRQTYLHIEYTSSGTREAQDPPACQREFAFTPNPTIGRFVTVRYNIEAGTHGKLTLRDVLGRKAKSFTLDPSESTSLDLRGLAPGVYFATLDAGSQSLARKLVIIAR